MRRPRTVTRKANAANGHRLLVELTLTEPQAGAPGRGTFTAAMVVVDGPEIGKQAATTVTAMDAKDAATQAARWWADRYPLPKAVAETQEQTAQALADEIARMTGGDHDYRGRPRLNPAAEHTLGYTRQMVGGLALLLAVLRLPEPRLVDYDLAELLIGRLRTEDREGGLR